MVNPNILLPGIEKKFPQLIKLNVYEILIGHVTDFLNCISGEMHRKISQGKRQVVLCSATDGGYQQRVIILFAPFLRSKQESEL